MCLRIEVVESKILRTASILSHSLTTTINLPPKLLGLYGIQSFCPLEIFVFSWRLHLSSVSWLLLCIPHRLLGAHGSLAHIIYYYQQGTAVNQHSVAELFSIPCLNNCNHNQVHSTLLNYQLVIWLGATLNMYLQLQSLMHSYLHTITQHHAQLHRKGVSVD